MGIMKALYISDKAKRSKIHLFEEKVQCLKTLKINNKLGLIWWSRHKLGQFGGRKINTRCIISGRGKAINQNFKLSRLEFRRWAYSKMLPGLIKASW